jgi:hypothetical protein
MLERAEVCVVLGGPAIKPGQSPPRSSRQDSSRSPWSQSTASCSNSERICSQVRPASIASRNGRHCRSSASCATSTVPALRRLVLVSRRASTRLVWSDEKESLTKAGFILGADGVFYTGTTHKRGPSEKQRWWRTLPERWLDAGRQLCKADLADVGRRLSDESLVRAMPESAGVVPFGNNLMAASANPHARTPGAFNAAAPVMQQSGVSDATTRASVFRRHNLARGVLPMRTAVRQMRDAPRMGDRSQRTRSARVRDHRRRRAQQGPRRDLL